MQLESLPAELIDMLIDFIVANNLEDLIQLSMVNSRFDTLIKKKMDNKSLYPVIIKFINQKIFIEIDPFTRQVVRLFKDYLSNEHRLDLAYHNWRIDSTWHRIPDPIRTPRGNKTNLHSSILIISMLLAMSLEYTRLWPKDLEEPKGLGILLLLIIFFIIIFELMYEGTVKIHDRYLFAHYKKENEQLFKTILANNPACEKTAERVFAFEHWLSLQDKKMPGKIPKMQIHKLFHKIKKESELHQLKITPKVTF